MYLLSSACVVAKKVAIVSKKNNRLILNLFIMRAMYPYEGCGALRQRHEGVR